MRFEGNSHEPQNIMLSVIVLHFIAIKMPAAFLPSLLLLLPQHCPSVAVLFVSQYLSLTR